MNLAVAAPTDDIDTVTLQQAMSSRSGLSTSACSSTASPERRRVSRRSIRTLPADVWEAVVADVRQHVMWHTDTQFTAHALPGGRERITRGPDLDDPVVYEDPQEAGQ